MLVSSDRRAPLRARQKYADRHRERVPARTRSTLEICGCSRQKVYGERHPPPRRAIPPGEELFYDYGLEVDEPRTKKLEKEYACHCGSPKCRGTMLGD